MQLPRLVARVACLVAAATPLVGPTGCGCAARCVCCRPPCPHRFVAGFLPLLLGVVLATFNVVAEGDSVAGQLNNSIGIALVAVFVLPMIAADGVNASDSLWSVPNTPLTLSPVAAAEPLVTHPLMPTARRPTPYVCKPCTDPWADRVPSLCADGIQTVC